MAMSAHLAYSEREMETIMNCTTCNTSASPSNLRHGLCLNCLGHRCTEQLNEIQRLNVELREARNERHLWEMDRARYAHVKRLRPLQFADIKWGTIDGNAFDAVVDEQLSRLDPGSHPGPVSNSAARGA